MLAYLPSDVAAEVQRRLQLAILVVQERHVGDAQDLARVGLLLASDRRKPLLSHLAIAAALAAVGADDVDDLPPVRAPLGHGARAAVLGVIRVGHHHHGPIELLLLFHLGTPVPSD